MGADRISRVSPDTRSGAAARGSRDASAAAAVLRLQHGAGNRAVGQLARAKAPRNIETTFVTPAVRKLLGDHKIAFAEQVVFDLLDDQGKPVLRGRFDVVFRDPRTKELVFPELKGDSLDSLTKGQKVYVPLFESPEGARVRIVSKKGGTLAIDPTKLEGVHGKNFLRVGKAQLPAFTAMVTEMATGKRATNVWYSKELQAFSSQADFEKFAESKGIQTHKPVSHPKPPVSAGDRPLKPPPATDKTPPNALYDKPKPGGWDPTSGPPQPGRKGPVHMPAPVDKPGKATVKAPVKVPGVSGPAVVVPTSTATRKIVIDGNVLDQIFRGNATAARKLKELTAKHEVYISWHAFNEVVVNPGVQTTKDVATMQAQRMVSETKKHIIEKLGIKITPPAPSAVMTPLLEKNTLKGTRTVLSTKDLRVAADAAAVRGEVWAFDSAFRNGAVSKTLGVKVAGETFSINKVDEAANMSSAKKAERALRLLKLEPPARGALPSPPVPSAPAPPTSAPKAPVTPEPSGAGAKATKEVGAAAAETAGKGPMYKRVAAKLGKGAVFIIDGLIPDPTDALELMYDFAGSYKAARDAIRKENLQTGFAMGLAAYLVVPEWEFASHHIRKFADRSVATMVVGAVGVAENAYNEGLLRGFLYGEKHSPAQAQRLRQQVFDDLLRRKVTPGSRYDYDTETWTFGREEVYKFGAALYKYAGEVIKEAERRRKARIASEELRKEAERWSRPPIGGAKY